MSYDQLIENITALGQGDKDFGCLRFFQQRGILHQERNCEKCGTEMRISTHRGKYVWRCKKSDAKRRNKMQSGTHRHHLKGYIDEFIFRRHASINNLCVFDELLKGIVAFMPPF